MGTNPSMEGRTLFQTTTSDYGHSLEGRLKMSPYIIDRLVVAFSWLAQMAVTL